MPKTPARRVAPDPRIDAYLDQCPAFAQPILRHWRALVHQTCPEAEETMKWSRPHFTYRGKLLTGMSAFKAHCAIGFWHGEAALQAAVEAEQGQAPGTGSALADKAGQAMGQLGRLTSLADLPPPATQQAMIRRAMALIEAGAKPAHAPSAAGVGAGAAGAPPAPRRPAPDLPADLAQALAAHPAAQATYQAFPPGQQREYVDWLDEARKPETRARRLAQAVAWMAEGKRRNWKYERC